MSCAWHAVQDFADERTAVPRTVAIANLKGGTGKTTTAAYLGHAWASLGARVAFVDADPQRSLSEWAEIAGWALPVIGMASRQMHTQLPGVLTDANCDIVVIDTPPLEDQHGIVASALRAADEVVVAMAPTMAELHRAGAVFDAIEDADALRRIPVVVSVLLNRVDLRSKVHNAVRSALAGGGSFVLEDVVPLRQSIAQAFGAPVDAGGLWARIVEQLDARAADAAGSRA